MADSDWQTDLTEILVEKGHSPKEIQKILARVRKHEAEMQVDSVMDSIDSGRFDLAAIIAEALKMPD